jgi:ElaB/YqjD/DUF883 family membrane-anchored ribosome-binding protein
LGVATPTDLIQSHNTSAFNIGYAVEMAGFTLTEALPLMQGLASKVANPQDYLAEAVKWTGGQPFLIQRLLGMMEKELAGIAPTENIADWVENLVQERIVTNWESQDAPPHLTTIRDRVISVEEKLRGRMLGCYQQVLADGELEDDRSEERSKLRLTGLVVRRDGRLISYNPIYGAVFNNAWVEGQLADLRPDFYGSAFRAWQDAEEAQNQGFLLRGQALEEAEVWARGKRLSDGDDQFLRESREFEKKERNRELESERVARETLEEANCILAEASKKAELSLTKAQKRLQHFVTEEIQAKNRLSMAEKLTKQTKLAGIGVGVIAGVITIGVLVWSSNFRKEALKGIEIEIEKQQKIELAKQQKIELAAQQKVDQANQKLYKVQKDIDKKVYEIKELSNKMEDLTKASNENIQSVTANANKTIEEIAAKNKDEKNRADVKYRSTQARELIANGVFSAQNGKIKEALNSFSKSREFDRNVKISAAQWYQLCWNGNVFKFGKDVAFACEKAVEEAYKDNTSEDDKSLYHDIRGVSRAISGKNEGAIKDFEKYIARFRGKSVWLTDKRKKWIESLRKQINPFTDPQELEDLKYE